MPVKSTTLNMIAGVYPIGKLGKNTKSTALIFQESLNTNVPNTSAVCSRILCSEQPPIWKYRKILLLHSEEAKKEGLAAGA